MKRGITLLVVLFCFCSSDSKLREAEKIYDKLELDLSTFKAIEKGNWGQAGLNVAIFALGGLTSKGVNAIMGNANGIAAELGRAGLNGIASAGLSKLSGGDFSSGFFRGAVGSLAFSGLGKLQGGRRKSSGGNYQSNPCPKGYNCADLGSITIEAARRGRWRDYIPGWGNGEYYSNPVVKGVHDAGRQFMSHPVTQGAMFVGTSLISGGILNSYKVLGLPLKDR